MLSVGLTGNIGSGKTLVAKVFSALGIPVFNADMEARDLYLRPDIIREVVGIAGRGILGEDGMIDRPALASLVFTDKAILEKINRLVHPLVREGFARKAEMSPDSPYIIYEAAILIETGYFRELDRIIFVTAPEQTRIKRVMERDGISAEQVLLRMANQWPENEKIKFADHVICNDGSRMLLPQVLEIHQILRVKTGT